MSNILHRIINTSTTQVATITNITFSDQTGIQHHANLSAIGLSSDFTGKYAAVSYSKNFVSGSPISRNYLSDTADIVKTIVGYDTTTLVVNNTTNLVAGWQGSGVYAGRYIVSITSATWLLMSNTPTAPPTPGASITFSTSTHEITLSGTSPTTGINPGWYINSNGYSSSGTVLSVKSSNTLVVDFLPTNPAVGNPLVFSTSTKINYVELDSVSSLVNGLYAWGNGFTGQQITNILGNIVTMSGSPSTYPVVGQTVGFGTGNIYTIPVNSEVGFNLDFTTSTSATGTYTCAISVDIWQGLSNTTYYYNDYVVLSRANAKLPNPTPGNINPSGYYSSYIDYPGYSPGYSIPFVGFEVPRTGRVEINGLIVDGLNTGVGGIASDAAMAAGLLMFNNIDTFGDVASVNNTALTISQLATQYSDYRSLSAQQSVAQLTSVGSINNNTDPAQAAQQVAALQQLSQHASLLVALSDTSWTGIQQILADNAANGKTPANTYALAALAGIQTVVQTVSDGINWLSNNLSLSSISNLSLNSIASGINSFVNSNQYVSMAVSSVQKFVSDIGQSLQSLVPGVNLGFSSQPSQGAYIPLTPTFGDTIVRNGIAIASTILSPTTAVLSTLATLAGFNVGITGQVNAGFVTLAFNSMSNLIGDISKSFSDFGKYISESVSTIFGSNQYASDSAFMAAATLGSNGFVAGETFSLTKVWEKISNFGTDVAASVNTYSRELVTTVNQYPPDSAINAAALLGSNNPLSTTGFTPNQTVDPQLAATFNSAVNTPLNYEGTLYNTTPITSNITTSPYEDSQSTSVTVNYNSFSPTTVDYGAFGEPIISGGDGSVNVNAYMPGTSKLAGQMILGDSLVLLSKDRQGTTTGMVISNTISEQKLLTMVSESGIRLTCSDNTPLTLEDGSSINSTEVLGKKLPVEDQNGFRWELIVEVLDAGQGKVATIYCEDQCYAAGDENGRWIWTHNASNIKYGDFAANFQGSDILSLNLGNN